MILPKTKKIFLIVLLLIISGILAVVNKFTSGSYKTPSAQAEDCWAPGSSSSGCGCSTGGEGGEGGEGCGGCY